MSELHEIITLHMQFVKLEKYENELQAINCVSESSYHIFKEITLKWIHSLKQQTNNQRCPSDMKAESNRLREQGNKIFTSKAENRDILEAAALYTRAIFAAPAASEALALAYANRAMALQEFGYFQQAYDDCECALDCDLYPKRLLPKIHTRQAHCAKQLNDVDTLKIHLDALDAMSLNEHFIQQKTQLHCDYTELLKAKLHKTIVNSNDDSPLHRETQKILESPEGRQMVASELIKENELIFSERASSFVPVAGWRICQECAALLLIPIPCSRCHGQVVYCSLKCRRAHVRMHSFECAGYQMDLFSKIGIAHLAFRVMIEGLIEIMPLLYNKMNSKEIWKELDITGSIAKDSKVEYSKTLCMITHLDKMTLEDIIWFCLVAKILVLYLKEFTNFFSSMHNHHHTAALNDWESIAAALLLRHIGQLIVNGHTCMSVVPAHYSATVDHRFEFALLSSSIWLRPYHVRRGFLHHFCDFSEIATANFPYLSICNHSCWPTLRSQFNGRFVSTYAEKNIQPNEEIFNCYVLDYRKSVQAVRQNELKATYHFRCECTKCNRAQPDEDYEAFHRYRCKNKKCAQIFVLHLPKLPNRNWSENINDDNDYEPIKCTACGAEQSMRWFTKFKNLLQCTNNTASRHLLYKRFETLKEFLVDNNEISLSLAYQLVTNCIASHYAGYLLDDTEFDSIVRILKFSLAGLAEQSGINSIEYTVKMTYLWDIIALGKYKCSRNEIQNMLKSMTIVSNEFQMVFKNYYKNFIEPNLC